MRIPFSSGRLWQCIVFLIWALFEVGIVGVRVAGAGEIGLVTATFALVAASVALLRGFLLAVRSISTDHERGRSLVALAFLYSSGALAVILQTVWFVLLRNGSK